MISLMSTLLRSPKTEATKLFKGGLTCHLSIRSDKSLKLFG